MRISPQMQDTRTNFADSKTWQNTPIHNKRHIFASGQGAHRGPEYWARADGASQRPSGRYKAKTKLINTFIPNNSRETRVKFPPKRPSKAHVVHHSLKVAAGLELLAIGVDQEVTANERN